MCSFTNSLQGVFLSQLFEVTHFPTYHAFSNYISGELERWRAGELESWRAGELESWRGRELVERGRDWLAEMEIGCERWTEVERGGELVERGGELVERGGELVERGGGRLREVERGGERW